MTKKLNSNILQKILTHLLDDGYKVTFEGKAWSNVTGKWVYINTRLNTDKIIDEFDHNRILKTHKNEDPKSGREKGLIDESTGEAIMGEF